MVVFVQKILVRNVIEMMYNKSKSREKLERSERHREVEGSSSRGYSGSPESGSEGRTFGHYTVKVLTNSTGNDQGLEKAPVDGAIKRNQGAKS
ncbi:hypothetical protein K1719_001421 [Acacia pycnantha]|nr:hypothetical protein K1719_001421 [Acacia pycnantha]